LPQAPQHHMPGTFPLQCVSGARGANGIPGLFYGVSKMNLHHLHHGVPVHWASSSAITPRNRWGEVGVATIVMVVGQPKRPPAGRWMMLCNRLSMDTCALPQPLDPSICFRSMRENFPTQKCADLVPGRSVQINTVTGYRSPQYNFRKDLRREICIDRRSV